MSRILSDKERSILLKAYKDDRMKDAPANISDKTLIENYGTNEQKKLLSGFTPTEPAPKGTENKASENKGTNTEPPANGGNTGSGDGAGADKGSEEEDKKKAEKELEYEKSVYFRLYGENPNEAFTVDEIRAANLTKAKELEAEAAKGSGDNTAYLDAFNQYVKLHEGKAPAKELTTEQLVEANNKRIEELKNVQAAPKQKEQTPAKKAPAKEAVKGVDMVELYNTKTNETKTFARFTWENYMKGKEKDWQLKPTEPEEVQGL